MGASVTLSDHDMPLPDIVLTRAPRGEGPIPLESVALIVEVSSSTLQRNMGDKLAIYARAGVPEYWVVNMNGRVIHQMWTPSGDGYQRCERTAFGERMTAIIIPALSIETAEL